MRTGTIALVPPYFVHWLSDTTTGFAHPQSSGSPTCTPRALLLQASPPSLYLALPRSVTSAIRQISSPHFVYFSRCLSTCQYDDLSKLYKSFLGIFLVPDVIDFYLLLDASQCVGRSKYKPNNISFCGYSNFLLYNLDKSS